MYNCSLENLAGLRSILLISFGHTMVKESYRTVRRMGLKAWPPIMSSGVPLGCRVDATSAHPIDELPVVGIRTYVRIHDLIL